MLYKECSTIFVYPLGKHLTITDQERTKVLPEELPLLPAFLCSSTKKLNQVSTFCIT